MKKKKAKAQYGYPNPWDTLAPQQPQYNIPAYEQLPQVQPMGQTMDYAPTNAPMMQIQSNNQYQPSQPQQRSNTGQQIGNIASGIGRSAGQALNAMMVGGPQLINALLPEQQLYREDRTLKRNYNPYPQGISGSQAIYENGGYVERTRRAGKSGRIQVTEEIPEYFPIQEPSSYMETTSPYLQNYQEQFNPQPVQPSALPRQMSYQKMNDIRGNLSSYAPVFQNYNYNDAVQTMQQLPEYIDNTPVMRSPSQYSELFQNFQPNTQDYQWQPYPTEGYIPSAVTPFEFGGEIEAKSGIHIKKENRGKFNATKERTGKTTEELTHSKNPVTKKRAVFAQNAKGWKKGEFGALIEGQEYELSKSDIQNLLNQGYELEF